MNGWKMNVREALAFAFLFASHAPHRCGERSLPDRAAGMHALRLRRRLALSSRRITAKLHRLPGRRVDRALCPCMATNTISLELDAYGRLRRAKREGESFSGVVRRARFGPANACGSSILTALGELPVRASDEEAARLWEESGIAERTASPSAWEGGDAL